MARINMKKNTQPLSLTKTSAKCFLSLFANPSLITLIKKNGKYSVEEIIPHQFPDEETSVTIHSDVKNKDVIVLTSLERPNAKILALLFLAEIARNLGAKNIILIVPYLVYMRQDKEFKSGQGVSAKYFAQLLSKYFDALITVDPHLHRYHSLGEIYSIPTKVLHAINPIANWIKSHVKKPLIIGPDKESQQWAQAIAQLVDAPLVMLQKIRKGDRLVEMMLPDLDRYSSYTPVLIDDIISTGKTMLEAVKQLKQQKMQPAVCIAVHAVFAEDAYASLLGANIAQVVTCNTIQHASNAIDVSELIADNIIGD